MKKLLTGILGCSLLLGLVGCGNKQFIDTTYVFNKAMIKLQDEQVVTVDISSWRDFEGSDQIQIKTTDGTTYLVHTINCTLIAGGK